MGGSGGNKSTGRSLKRTGAQRRIVAGDDRFPGKATTKAGGVGGPR